MSEDPDRLAEEEADAAAAEARAIGGRPTRDLEPGLSNVGDAMKPVYEAGGGDQEGWEMAEEELREHAEQGPAKPEAQVRVRAERDAEESEGHAVYGEPDEMDVTEVVQDPNRDPRDDASPRDPHTKHDRL
jgi:hypothetical protein